MNTTVKGDFGDFLKDWKPSTITQYRMSDKEFGRLQNAELLKGNAVFQNSDTNYQPKIVKIEIGMPATYSVGTDSYATKVTAIEYFKTGERKGQIKSVSIEGQKETFKPYMNSYGVKFSESKKIWWAVVKLGYGYDYQDPHF
jgi:hypothetical protein